VQCGAREEKAERSADYGNGERFDNELQRNAGAGSAERGADSELAGAVRGPGGVETAEIDAGGDEHQRGEEHERAKKTVQRSTERVADEAERRDAEDGLLFRPKCLLFGILTGELLRDAIEVRLRLTYGDAGAAAAHDPGVLVVAIVEEAVALDLLLVPEVGPDVGTDEALGALKARASDTEDDKGLLRDADGAADDVGVGGEVGLPGGVAEDGIGAAIGAVRVIAVMKETAEQRGDAERVEVAAGGLQVKTRLRLSISSEADLEKAIGADLREGVVASAQIAVDGEGKGDVFVRTLLDEGELAGLGEGGRTQEESVDDAEDDDVGGDPESQSENRGGGEAGTAAKLAQGVAEIGKESGHGVLSCGG
jgi:hypothetical protein